MGMLLKGGLVIDPHNDVCEIMDVLIENGVVARTAKDIEAPPGTEVVCAEGMWVTPGLIDLHVHFREPGFEYKETIADGAAAAARGGFTTVCCMANTNPVIDCGSAVRYVSEKAKNAPVNVLQLGSATKGMLGREISDFEEMLEAGICGISEDGKTITNAALYRLVLEHASRLNLTVFSHCEDTTLSQGGIFDTGGAARIKNNFRTDIAEEVIIARDIILAESVGARLHICHVSTKAGVRLITEALERGFNVTAEAAPHHFTLSDWSVGGSDANFKMSPPLRSREDVESIRRAISEGVIGCIATDHAPHAPHEKNCTYSDAANGVIGLETSLALGITELVGSGLLTPSGLIERMSLTPAKVLGIDKGALSKDFAADITVIDPNAVYTINPDNFASKGRNCPFNGKTVRGKALMTIRGGNVVYKR